MALLRIETKEIKRVACLLTLVSIRRSASTHPAFAVDIPIITGFTNTGFTKQQYGKCSEGNNQFD